MDESLHQLAASGNLRYIKKALETPNLFYSTDEDNGWTPLHYASNKSKVKIVSVILEAGVDPNTPSKPVSVKQSSWNLAIIKDEESSIVTAMDVADGPNRHKIIGMFNME